MNRIVRTQASYPDQKPGGGQGQLGSRFTCDRTTCCAFTVPHLSTISSEVSIPRRPKRVKVAPGASPALTRGAFRLSGSLCLRCFRASALSCAPTLAAHFADCCEHAHGPAATPVLTATLHAPLHHVLGPLSTVPLPIGRPLSRKRSYSSRALRPAAQADSAGPGPRSNRRHRSQPLSRLRRAHPAGPTRLLGLAQIGSVVCWLTQPYHTRAIAANHLPFMLSRKSEWTLDKAAGT
jgi:hypothetical protein